MKFCTLVYLDHLQNWLVYGHGLLIFLILALNSSLPAIKSTRLETLRAILRAKGHSRKAAHMMSRSLRDSSLQMYESHWARFVSFCRSKRWHVSRVRSHNFSTYMMHLFRDGLHPATIISHRKSVASVFRHWVYDSAADPHIKLLIRAFRLERPVQCRIMPKRDLHLGGVNRCLFTGIATAGISWELRSHISRWIMETVKEAYTQADRETMTKLLHMRSEPCQHHGLTTFKWPYLTSCQRRFGGHLGSSRILIYATWRVSLMACLHWVQWWLHFVDPGHLHPPPQPTRSVCSHCYDVLNEDYLIISW